MNKLLAFLFTSFLFMNNCFAAVKFDAADDIVNCGVSDAIFLYNQPLTISAWISPDTAGESNGGRIFEKASGVTRGVLLNTAATSTLRFFVFGSTSLTRQAANSSITFGSYQHVLVTWDGSITASNAHIYVNGTEVTYATTTNGATLTDNSGDGIHIGNDSGAVRTYDGNIDEVAVWNVVLTSQEIAQLASSRLRRMPLQVRPANLQGYWALDRTNSGSSADGHTYIDLSGNGRTCTADNGANNTGMTGALGASLTYP